jgi:hypothetical protein
MKEIQEVRSAISDGIRSKIIKSLTPKENFKRKFDFSQVQINSTSSKKNNIKKVETVIYSNSSDSESEECDQFVDNISLKPNIKTTPIVKKEVSKNNTPQKRVSRGSFRDLNSRKVSTNNNCHEV